ncbi:hypothetical protein BV97_04367 [Novosphingobium resinovorum]|uniref:Uncharacterized protein n=1 Tax=Novosphingobium resinovorum TaxID=158500 RepID=A0A031JPU9_9SPHN|nr:hypothetical protein [Novosphingobium resinovorum]EZP77798.1 hypothetical protein BV97_04367 [Novosphingobium resinovorum]
MTDDTAPIIVELVPLAAPVPKASAPLGEMQYRSDSWTPQEVRTLRQLFTDDIPLLEISEALGRGLQGVRDKVCTLGLRRHSTRPWSELEDHELIQTYGQEPAATIAARLGRSCGAVYTRAAILGLSEQAAPAWTPWEDAQLRAGFAADIPTAQVALIIGRPHAGVYSRAGKLGIKHASSPKGWTNAEIERAIELVQAGHTYTQIGVILGTEGFATRTKSSLQALMQRTGQGKGWGRVWMPEEDELLIKAYRENASLTPLRNRLGRSVFSIRWRAEYLNLRGTHARSKGWRLGPDWSEADEAWLRRDYGKTPTPELARQMGRTRAAIFTRANILGLVHEGRQRWTPDHLAALRIAHEHGISLADLAAALGREAGALHKYAAKQGLIFGRRPRWPQPPTLADILNLPEAAKGKGEG